MKKLIVKTIIFDLDGTLFQSEILAVPAFHDTLNRLRAEGLYAGPIHDDQVLKSMFGKTNEEIWPELLPNVSAEVIAKADQYMGDFELLRLHRGEGRLYSGVAEIMQALHQKGYRLCIASNGGERYVRGVADYYFSGLFAGVYSAGGYRTSSKVDLVKLIVDRFSDGSLVMVGDRSSDIEAGKENQLLTIGCNYGFGQNEELVDADYLIDDFCELLGLF